MKQANLEEVLFLWCRITGQKLIPVSKSTLNELNKGISEGRFIHYDGRKASEPVEFGFINEEGSLVYPVQGGVILALKSFAIILDPAKISPSEDNDFYKSLVKDFYDDYGWSQEGESEFVLSTAINWP